MTKDLKQLAAMTVSGSLNRRAFMSRAAALGASTAMAGSFLGTAARAATPQKGGTFKVAISGGQSTDSLDPALAANDTAFVVLKHFGDYLVETDVDGSLIMRLASAVESSADAKVWTFTIREGVSFHNGATLAATDVIATLRRHASEESQSGALGVLRGIETIEDVDGKVVITLTDGNADLPYLLSDYHLIIQPNGGVDAPDAGVGTGPYKIVQADHGVRYTFEKFADYWDDSRGHVDAVELLVISDDTARMAALQSGQVHIANRVPPKIAGLIERHPQIDIHSAGGPGHYVFNMFCDTAPFDNNELRLALKYAIDRQQMVDSILFGHGSIGNDMPINAAYPLFSDDIEQRIYDPEKAAAHYKASGHEGPIVLRTADASFPGAVDAAQLLQQSAQAAGIKIEIKREPNDGYWSEVWNKQPFSTSFWGGRPTQDAMYSTAYLSTADWNDTNFRRSDFDAKLLKARVETNQDARKALYHDMGVMIHNEGGAMIPMFANWVEGTRAEVDGWFDDPAQTMMNGMATIKCWLKA